MSWNNSKRIRQLWQAALVVSLWLLLLHSSSMVSAKESELTPSKPEKFALLVGINNYNEKNFPKLTGCVNDVNGLRSVLIKNYSFPADVAHIKVLLNEQATKKAI